jgi:hypothetical protein
MIRNNEAQRKLAPPMIIHGLTVNTNKWDRSELVCLVSETIIGYIEQR